MVRVLYMSVTALFLASTQAFVLPLPRPFGAQHAPSSTTTTTTTTTSARNMGLFDFFSEDARKERDERREREIEEQERLQAQILARRADPEKMADYEARVAVRRRAIMAGEDGSKIKVMVDDDEVQ